MALKIGKKKKTVVDPAKIAKAKEKAAAKAEKAEKKAAAKAAKAEKKAEKDGQKPVKTPRGPSPYGGVMKVVAICGFMLALCGGCWTFEFLRGHPDIFFNGFMGGFSLLLVIALVGGVNEELGKISQGAPASRAVQAVQATSQEEKPSDTVFDPLVSERPSSSQISPSFGDISFEELVETPS